MLSCTCPLGASLPSVADVACPSNFGQLQKVIFQRVKNQSAEGDSKINSVTGDETIASIRALMAATGDTKMVLSPYIEAPTTEPGEAITYGSGNEVVGGIPIVVGRNATAFSGVIRQKDQAVIKALKQLECEATQGGVGVYLINESGQVAGSMKEGTTGGSVIYTPFPIRSLFFSDLILGGLEEPDGNNVSWNFLPNWSDDFAIIPFPFNALEL